MVVLIDGVKYRLSAPENEAALERQVEENHRHIFGENSIYFPKKKIKSKAGIGTIPDAYLIIPDHKLKWCILEVELASHSVYDHVFPQLTKFRRAIEDSTSRKKIRDFFYDTITGDPVLEAKFRKQIGTGEIHKTLSDMMDQKPLIVVAIDERTDELDEALLDFGGEVKIVEFKAYEREGCPEINAYVFEPVISRGKKAGGQAKVSTAQPGGGTRRGGRRIGTAIYALFDEKGMDNVTCEECKELARQVKPDTAFNKNHYSWYKNQYRKEKGKTERNKELPEGLDLFRFYKGQRFTAKVIEGGKIKFNGQIFSSPSLAAVAAIQSAGSNRTTAGGWQWWKFVDSATGEESPIDVLREK